MQFQFSDGAIIVSDLDQARGILAEFPDSREFPFRASQADISIDLAWALFDELWAAGAELWEVYNDSFIQRWLLETEIAAEWCARGGLVTADDLYDGEAP